MIENVSRELRSRGVSGRNLNSSIFNLEAAAYSGCTAVQQ